MLYTTIKYIIKSSFEALRDEIIKSTYSKFEATSNRLINSGDNQSLKLVGYFFVKNLDSECKLIKMKYKGELTIFTKREFFKI